MIIIKTSNGDMFVNEKETQMVQHDKANKMVVIRSRKEGLNCNIKDVESVIYTNADQTVKYEDQSKYILSMYDEYIGMQNEIARLRAKLRDYGCEL